MDTLLLYSHLRVIEFWQGLRSAAKGARNLTANAGPMIHLMLQVSKTYSMRLDAVQGVLLMVWTRLANSKTYFVRTKTGRIIRISAYLR